MSTGALPNNIEAEQAFLGILINESAVLTALEIIPSADDFFIERHRIIAQSIYTLSDTKAQIDIISLSETLRINKSLEKVGGVAYLAELTDKGLSSKNVGFYVSLIIEKSQRRGIIQHAQHMLLQAKDESIEINTLIEENEKEIFSITNKDHSNNYAPASNYLRNFLETVQSRMKNYKPGEYFGIETKFQKLDSILTGLHAGELIVLAARASIGKTAFTLNLLNNIAIDNEIPAAFFSLEMSGVDLISRLVSMRTGIHGEKFRKNNITPTDLSKIMHEFGNKFNIPLFISDAPSMNIFDLRVQARRLVATEHIKIIFIDYLGLIGYHNESGAGGNAYIPRFEKVSEISKSLKSLARELKIPIVVLAQLNRESEGKTPTLANIRDSGAIEQDADVVMMLHRNREETETKLIIMKHRNGPTGLIDLEFISSIASFKETASVSKNFD